MNKIFYFKYEDKYKRLYCFNFKLFKIKKCFSNKHIKNIIKNIDKIINTANIEHLKNMNLNTEQFLTKYLAL